MDKILKIIENNGVSMISIDGEVFDWGLEPEDVQKLKFACGNDPEMTESYIGNIKSHILSCFSEFLGREVGMKELNDSIEKGII